MNPLDSNLRLNSDESQIGFPQGMEEHLMEDDHILDGDISLETLALIDNHVRELEEQLDRTGYRRGTMIVDIGYAPQNRGSLENFVTQVTPRPFFMRLQSVSHSEMLSFSVSETKSEMGKTPFSAGSWAREIEVDSELRLVVDKPNA